MRMIFALLFLALCGGLVWLVARLQRRYYLTQYLFFVRYPLAMGLGLFVFPLFAIKAAPGMLANLFSLGPVEIVAVMLFACVGAWSVGFTAMLIFVSAPFRTGLWFSKAAENQEVRLPDQRMATKAGYLALALVAPLAAALIVGADAGLGSAVIAVALGLALAVLLRYLVGEYIQDNSGALLESLEAWLGQRAVLHRFPMLRHLAPEAPASGRTSKVSKGTRANYRTLHFQALVSMGCSLAVYFLAGVFTNPVDYPRINAWVPALIHLLALFTVATWVFGAVSYLSDKYRIPAVGLAVLFLMAWRLILGVDYRYPVGDWRGKERPPNVFDALDAFEARGDSSPIVVVAASGGGISASVWTAEVLRGLGKSLEVEKFHRHVALVSSVSGGSVGSLYYIDSFGPGHTPQAEMDSVVQAAGDTSLSAATWGLVYADVFRLFAGEWFDLPDRGRAQESRWDSHLLVPGRTLGDWAEGVRKGWRPIPFFNATLEETGGRYILTPVAMPIPGRVPGNDFVSLFPGRDVSSATAARLSATFPYVTPLASPAVSEGEQKLAYHAGDGGYYDNSGIVSAVETIEAWLGRPKLPPPKGGRKIALIEIRAAGDPATQALPDVDHSLSNPLTGPIKTLYNMRSASQLDRNLGEIDLAQEAWQAAHGVHLQHFVFRLGEDVPLSWHLTEAQRDEISAHWPGTPPTPRPSRTIMDARAANQLELDRLIQFFHL